MPHSRSPFLFPFLSPDDWRHLIHCNYWHVISLTQSVHIAQGSRWSHSKEYKYSPFSLRIYGSHRSASEMETEDGVRLCWTKCILPTMVTICYQFRQRCHFGCSGSCKPALPLYDIWRGNNAISVKTSFELEEARGSPSILITNLIAASTVLKRF